MKDTAEISKTEQYYSCFIEKGYPTKFSGDYFFEDLPEEQQEYYVDKIYSLYYEFEALIENSQTVVNCFKFFSIFKMPVVDLLSQDIKYVNNLFGFLLAKIEKGVNLNHFDLVILDYIHEFILVTQEELSLEP